MGRDEWDAMKMKGIDRSSSKEGWLVIPRSLRHEASVFADARGNSRFLRPLEMTILEARYQPL
jgi:hypothetical protein